LSGEKTKKEFIFYEKDSSRKGLGTVLDRLEIVIRDISFLNNFYGAFFKNTVAEAKDYKKEINDFIEYWHGEMLKKNAPYYRISFMQTGIMNTFIPMTVTPSPDTSIRVFLDWEPLSEFKTIVPQQLVKTSRQGFTMVEWGGLKR
jgi:hypothetical protein